MRTREEIIESLKWGTQASDNITIIEVLLDIRDLLVEANRVDITSNEKPPLNDPQTR